MAARYRQTSTRDGSAAEPEATPAEPIKQIAKSRSNSLSVVDVLRILGGILLLSSAMSYLSTSGESMTWGYNPWWTRAREWKALLKGEINLTDDQLLTYDGTDPTKPIYLALNGTIYDVSANPTTYGPGGSYHFFAGRDAARAFLTGCFMDDRTPDLRGAEMMYMPRDPDATKPEEVEAARKLAESGKATGQLSKSALKNRQAQELRKARRQVRDGLEHWHQLFRGDKQKPYFKVGEVVRETGWLEKLPRRELCEQAEKSRPVRKEE
ncbi:hypothetical protein K491DRAFT_690904 [Lophiostoma macrostomum CBS 122681]|uniref:Cytochrome b5 heme-binding domain-containing protein n=1 Tax=Lophiostoma macrostomum CBS 122681 TaxID=1314788 RepID=A0A6A6TCD3_9PLEO|nr:hypothetical protein K491DRAFT_690904 [Lophiostoma macrostomum CBS 122681]